MKTTVTNGALAMILTNLLTNKESGEIDSMESFGQFVADLATVVADYCGGEVIADSQGNPAGGFTAMYAVEVGNIPEDCTAWSPALKERTLSATAVVQRLIDTFGEAIENDEEINGGDAVEQIVELYQMAKGAAGDGIVGYDQQACGGTGAVCQHGTDPTKISAAKKLDEIAQVVVFASGGITQSVAIRDLPDGDAPCIVVDYDDRHDDAGGISPEDFERKKLGIDREAFDKTATYIW